MFVLNATANLFGGTYTNTNQYPGCKSPALKVWNGGTLNVNEMCIRDMWYGPPHWGSSAGHSFHSVQRRSRSRSRPSLRTSVHRGLVCGQGDRGAFVDLVIGAVSYTHLDVYKRQSLLRWCGRCCSACRRCSPSPLPWPLSWPPTALCPACSGTCLLYTSH